MSIDTKITQDKVSMCLHLLLMFFFIFIDGMLLSGDGGGSTGLLYNHYGSADSSQSSGTTVRGQ